MLGNPVKATQLCEEPSLNWALKSLVAAKDLPAGKILSTDDIVSKRPGDGLSPSHKTKLLNRQLRHAIKRDHVVTIDDLL